MSSLRLGLLQRWMFFVFVMDARIFGLAGLVHIYFIAFLWRWVCGPIVGVTPFALCNFAFRPFMFVIVNSCIAFDNVSFFAHTCPRVVGRYLCFLVDCYFNLNAILVDGQCILFHANNLKRVYDPSALGTKLLYVGLFVVYEMFVYTASGGLASLVLKTGVSHTLVS